MMAVGVGLGAAVGALGRYTITRYLQPHVSNGWPLATLLINWFGSLLLGGLTAVGWGHWLVVTVGTGVLGGFTTYSTFSHEMVMLADQRRYGALISYLILSVGGGLALAALGFWGMLPR
ncbi:fluoride efflux transporter FluC [Levilactobacillus tangyuanensis]|uniref:Fluoride-specific ion channel FluC n=1 Tax=Levilactobacillus tangyuanensis TaxID=2486021 RepID=A0ABW1TKI2_9LACO|nr:CrcB family protein [Levilactobacillus tangyuanensis]